MSPNTGTILVERRWWPYNKSFRMLVKESLPCMVAYKGTPLRKIVWIPSDSHINLSGRSAAVVKRKAAAVWRKAAVVKRKAARSEAESSRSKAESSGCSRAESGRSKAESGRGKAESGQTVAVKLVMLAV